MCNTDTKFTGTRSVADPDNYLPVPDPAFKNDPDPGQNKFSAKFFLDIFMAEMCSKSIFMSQKIYYR
jgi:hypothetical protein